MISPDNHDFRESRLTVIYITLCKTPELTSMQLRPDGHCSNAHNHFVITVTRARNSVVIGFGWLTGSDIDWGVGWGIRLIVGFQPLIVISPTASWIRWCMQVYAWWFNVDLSCLGRTIYARQFLGAKPPIQFRHRWAERNHSDHLYWLRTAQSVS